MKTAYGNSVPVFLSLSCTEVVPSNEASISSLILPLMVQSMIAKKAQ